MVGEGAVGELDGGVLALPPHFQAPKAHDQGPGVRVRVRAYIHRSGDTYGWLDPDKYQEEEEN